MRFPLAFRVRFGRAEFPTILVRFALRLFQRAEDAACKEVDGWRAQAREILRQERYHLYGFTVLSVFMDGVIFWKPRNVRFGEIYSGNDEWVKRAKGSDIWNKRAIG
jgi:hypothetical protein